MDKNLETAVEDYLTTGDVTNWNKYIEEWRKQNPNSTPTINAEIKNVDFLTNHPNETLDLSNVIFKGIFSGNSVNVDFSNSTISEARVQKNLFICSNFNDIIIVSDSGSLFNLNEFVGETNYQYAPQDIKKDIEHNQYSIDIKDPCCDAVAVSTDYKAYLNNKEKSKQSDNNFKLLPKILYPTEVNGFSVFGLYGGFSINGDKKPLNTIGGTGTFTWDVNEIKAGFRVNLSHYNIEGLFRGKNDLVTSEQCHINSYTTTISAAIIYKNIQLHAGLGTKKEVFEIETPNVERLINPHGYTASNYIKGYNNPNYELSLEGTLNGLVYGYGCDIAFNEYLSFYANYTNSKNNTYHDSSQQIFNIEPGNFYVSPSGDIISKEQGHISGSITGDVSTLNFGARLNIPVANFGKSKELHGYLSPNLFVDIGMFNINFKDIKLNTELFDSKGISLITLYDDAPIEFDKIGSFSTPYICVGGSMDVSEKKPSTLIRF